MNYQNFVSTIKELVSNHLSSDTQLLLHTTLKNNAQERTGITFMNREFHIHPTLYLEEFYERYQDGATLDELAEYIAFIYQNLRYDRNFNVDFIFNFEEAMSQIAFKLIHAEKNRKLLQTMPYIPFHDLAIVFFLNCKEGFTGTASIPITNEIMLFWNTTTSKLYELARLNTPKILPATFKPMQEVIHELTGAFPIGESTEENIMYVLSNTNYSFGAAAILYDGVLSKIASCLGENFFILSSSVHEVIILPESKSPPLNHLQELLVTLNEHDTAEEDVLSNRVYYYDFTKRQLV